MTQIVDITNISCAPLSRSSRALHRRPLRPLVPCRIRGRERPLILEDGEYRGVFDEGDTLHRRYRLIRVLGSGTSGTVWEATDFVKNVSVAVKVYHRKASGERTSDHTIRAVHKLSSRPEASSSLIAECRDRFVHDRHWCMVSGMYGPSLRAVLVDEDLSPLQARQIKAIAWQIVRAVAFMHRVGVIHTDIKPDNIVLVTGDQLTVRDVNSRGEFCDKVVLRSVEIKLVDFDDSVRTGTHRHHTIGTNRYRAPEVTLGLEWDAPVDAFSVGCVLTELACGRPLFTASFDTAERIAAIETVVGFFPAVIVQSARRHNKGLFSRDWPSRVKFPPDSLKEEDMATSEAMARIASLSHFSTLVRHPEMSNLVRRLLSLNPHMRMTLAEAASHDYFYEFRKDL